MKLLAERRDLKVHMDGARIYNAAIALNSSISDIASYADTVQMCFSKGLGAPIGSIIVGPKDFIARARHSRKALGGGWRQSGVLAAAAHVALDHAETTIRADHERAKKLSKMINDATPEALRNVRTLSVHHLRIASQKVYAKENDITNMVLVHCENGVTVQQVAKKKNQFSIFQFFSSTSTSKSTTFWRWLSMRNGFAWCSTGTSTMKTWTQSSKSTRNLSNNSDFPEL